MSFGDWSIHVGILYTVYRIPKTLTRNRPFFQRYSKGYRGSRIAEVVVFMSWLIVTKYTGLVKSTRKALFVQQAAFDKNKYEYH